MSLLLTSQKKYEIMRYLHPDRDFADYMNAIEIYKDIEHFQMDEDESLLFHPDGKFTEYVKVKK